MEQQEPESLAPPLLPLDFDGDDEDEEYKVESDVEADESESDEGDEQEAFPQEEDTLHLLDIGDDLLDSLEEKVLSDSECVESDAEDEDEEVYTNATATNLAPGLPPPQQQQDEHDAAGCCSWPVKAHSTRQELGKPADGGSAAMVQHGTPLVVRRSGPLCATEQQQGQMTLHGVIGRSMNWDAMGSTVAATQVQHARQAVYQVGISNEPAMPITAAAGGPGGTSIAPPADLAAEQHCQGGPSSCTHGYVRGENQLLRGQPSSADCVYGAASGGEHIHQQRQAQEKVQDADQDIAVCPPSGGICRRTRAHMSLRNVDLSELEQQLPEHIDLEEIELAEDDEEYGKFLQSLFDDTTALPEDSSDEDPDFAADLDLDLEEASKDDGDDRAWLKLLNSPDREEGGSAGGQWGPMVDSPARRTRGRYRRGRGGGTAADAKTTHEEEEGAFEMTAEQLSILYAQVHCHAQLLVQTYVMFAGDTDSEAQDLAAKAKAMINQLSLCRDVQSSTRKLLGLPSYTPDDLLRPAGGATAPPQSAGSAPVASTGLVVSGGANGDRSAASGAAEGDGKGGIAAATASSDAVGRCRAQVKARGPQQPQPRIPDGAPGAAAAVGAPAAAMSILGYSEVSQDDISTTGNEWDYEFATLGPTAGMNALKAAAAARSASIGAAIMKFRPAWCPGPEGGVWSVLDVVPLRKFSEVQTMLYTLPPMRHSAMGLLRELQAIAKHKRKNRRRRLDDPLLCTLDWARPALQCLQGHIFTALVYNPVPPVPPSYWTFAEDDLLMYGMSRYGTNWRMISSTLLVTRNASQIANRYKNRNARRRTPEDDTDDGRADEQSAMAWSAPGASAAVGRKPQNAPVVWQRAPAPVGGPGGGGGVGQTAGPAVLTMPSLLQTAATLPATTGLVGLGANAAFLGPPMAPKLASMVHSARIVGLPPAVAAAHIMQAQQQLRAQSQSQPPRPAPPQVPLPVALQLLQLAKSGGTTGSAAAAVRLLALQLQEATTPAAIAALQSAAQQVFPQLANQSAIGALNATGAGATVALTGGQAFGGLLNGGGLIGRGGDLGGGSDGLGGTSALARATQLLQAGMMANNPTPLTTPLHHQVTSAPSQIHFQSAAPGGVSLPLPLPQSTTGPQNLPLLLSLGQNTASRMAPVVPTSILDQGPSAAAAAAAGVAAPEATQPAAPRAPSDAVERDVAGHGGDGSVTMNTVQHPTLNETALHPGGVEHGVGGPGPEPMDVPPSWQMHDSGQGEPMQWTPKPPPLPTARVDQGGWGGDCRSADIPAALAPASPDGRAAGTELPACVGTEMVVGWKQPHCGLNVGRSRGELPLLVAVEDNPATLSIKERAAVAAGQAGPSDPRLSHGKDLVVPAHHRPQAAQISPKNRPQESRSQQQQRDDMSPGVHTLQHDIYAHQQQAHQRHDLPSLSDNFTLGGISELLSHGPFKSGAATPATCVPPQGGLTSVCVSHGHTLSLLLGSSLGVSALLRSDADGDCGTPTKSVAAGPLGVDKDSIAPPGNQHSLSHREQAPGTQLNALAKKAAYADADCELPIEDGRKIETPGETYAHGVMVPTPRPSSPTSPTSAGGAAHHRLRAEGAAAPLPLRLAALRCGLDMTPSSDPKARRRSRIGAAAFTEGVARRDAGLDLAPSPFEGTAQNDHREGRGARTGAMAAPSYRPRQPLFSDDANADGQNRNGADGFHVPERLTTTEEDDDDGDAAAAGLARARKRLRLDTEDEVVVAKATPRLQTLFTGETLGAVAVGMRGLGSAANSVAASPLKPMPPSRRPTVVTVAAAAAVALASTNLAQLGEPQLQPEPQQQSQHSAGTGSSGGSKRHSDSTVTTSGASTKRVRPVKASLGADDADAAGLDPRSGRWEALIEAVIAPDGMANNPAAGGEPGSAQDVGRHQGTGTGVVQQPCRATGQKRIRLGAGQKPISVVKDRFSAWGAASGPHSEPLAVVYANVNVGTTEAVVACPATVTDGACPIAGVSAAPAKVSMKRQNSFSADAAAPAATKATGKGAAISVSPEGMAGLPAVMAAKPPKAPTRRGTAGAQRLTRVSAAAAPAVAGGPRAAPSTRQIRHSVQKNAPASGTAAVAPTSQPACTSPEASIVAHVDTAAAISPPSLAPHLLPPILSTPGAAVSETSSGALSLHSLLCGTDTLDIISLLPCMSTRSLAALGNVCSPTGRPDAALKGPADTSADAARPTAPEPGPSRYVMGPEVPEAHAPGRHDGHNGGPSTDMAAQPPPGFISPSHSQLLQLTPFATSGCTLGSLDILPLFSNSMDLWNALQAGSACGTTSRGPEARVMAGSTAAGDSSGNGEAPRGQQLTDPDVPSFMDPWSRFMASCSPTSHSQAEAAVPLPPYRSEYSLGTFHTLLAGMTGPRNSVADNNPATAAAPSSAPTTATEQAASAKQEHQVPGLRLEAAHNCTESDGAVAEANGDAAAVLVATTSQGREDDVSPPSAPAVARAESDAVTDKTGGFHEPSKPHDDDGDGLLAPIEVMTAGLSAPMGKGGLRLAGRPGAEATVAQQQMKPAPAEAVAAAKMRPLDGDFAEMKSPDPPHPHAANPNAIAVGDGKPAVGAVAAAPGGPLPPLPPPFPRPRPAPSPVTQPRSESRPTPSETVRLFGRTVVKPLPITSPTMPAPSKLLRSTALVAAPSVAAAAGAAIRPLQLAAPECPAAPMHARQGDGIPTASVAAAVDENSNSRSQPETRAAPQVVTVLPPLGPPPLALQTPMHSSARGRDSLFQHMLSPTDIPPGSALGVFDTPLNPGAAAANTAPTPVQPPRATAVTAVQQTPATVTPAGRFAIPNTHATVAIAAPLSLTPLPALDATAAKTVGRQGPWEPRRLQAPLGMPGPSISHWASNDHDLGQEHAAPGTELERQGSVGLRNGPEPCRRGARTGHGTCGSGTVDTPGHVTCFSKVAQRRLVVVDPLVMPSPSVVQPTPRGRVQHGDDGDEVVPQGPSRSPCIGNDQYEGLESPQRSDKEGNDEDGTIAGNKGGDDAHPCRSPAASGADGRRDRSEGGGAQEELEEEEVLGADFPGGHTSVVAIALPTALVDAGATANRCADAVARQAPITATKQEPVKAAMPAEIGTAAATAESLTWSKEQDQLVMREIFRMGEGPSTWRSVSEQLGPGTYTVEVVEARAKQLMARLMLLM